VQPVFLSSAVKYYIALLQPPCGDNLHDQPRAHAVCTASCTWTLQSHPAKTQLSHSQWCSHNMGQLTATTYRKHNLQIVKWTLTPTLSPLGTISTICPSLHYPNRMKPHGTKWNTKNAHETPPKTTRRLYSNPCSMITGWTNHPHQTPTNLLS